MEQTFYLKHCPKQEYNAYCKKDNDRLTAECNAYINQLRRVFGKEPDNCSYSVEPDENEKPQVIFRFEQDFVRARDYAVSMTFGLPQYWDCESIKELYKGGYKVNIKIGAWKDVP